MAITKDEAIGLHVAQWLPRGSLDLVEYAFRTSATLGAGLDRLARYGRLINDRLAVDVVRTGPGVRFPHRRRRRQPGAPAARGDEHRPCACGWPRTRLLCT
jgi:hypothetical protein